MNDKKNVSISDVAPLAVAAGASACRLAAIQNIRRAYQDLPLGAFAEFLAASEALAQEAYFQDLVRLKGVDPK